MYFLRAILDLRNVDGLSGLEVDMLRWFAVARVVSGCHDEKGKVKVKGKGKGVRGWMNGRMCYAQNVSFGFVLSVLRKSEYYHILFRKYE